MPITYRIHLYDDHGLHMYNRLIHIVQPNPRRDVGIMVYPLQPEDVEVETLKLTLLY
jgi:hypothetical protein